MRTGFINSLMSLAAVDEKINLVVGDLGYSVVESFAEQFPDRFLNAGVAEQNMTGLAAGMALASERTVFTYSIANFSTVRCLEQIRNDVCYHNANVKIVVVGGGVAYGAHGYTHFAVEDVALMRALPNITIAVPADPVEAKAITELCCAHHGPWYLRLGKNGEPVLHQDSLKSLGVGESIQLRDGPDGTLLVNGPLLANALDAADLLAESGINVRVISMPFVRPLDTAAIHRAIKETGFLLTIEEHSGRGGFGSVVAEVVAEQVHHVAFGRMHLPDKLEITGDQDFLRAEFGLTATHIRDRALQLKSI